MKKSHVSVIKKEVAWKDYMAKIMNGKNYLDHDVGDAEESQADCVSREEVVQE